MSTEWAFSSITQKDGESIKDFTVCLKSAALDCEFACPSCNFDLLPMNVKDQFRRGLANDILQTNILAKANQLKSSHKVIIEIPAQLTPSIYIVQQIFIPNCHIADFPDSGASICLAGSQHLEKLRVSPDELIPSFKRVLAVGGFQLICHGWLPVQFQIGIYSTKQPLYI